jgi:hypothetical protein
MSLRGRETEAIPSSVVRSRAERGMSHRESRVGPASVPVDEEPPAGTAALLAVRSPE